jgi:hypothetical protein
MCRWFGNARRHDLLDIDIAPPDLSAYEVKDHASD